MEHLGEFIANHWLLSTAFIVLAWLVFSDVINRKLSGMHPLDANQSVRLVNQQKGKFVDVREPDEFKKEHITDSLNLPLSTIEEDSSKLKNMSQPLVIVCASGQRAKGAAKKLQAKGFTEVYVLSGGLGAWKEAKLPLFS
ncbi:MAG TPA: rhodanese-like domain-containing protein [Methylophaga aminisulfidivorans]|uniref:Rhodanese-like domain-containing protein n=2 Tax=root TaxID=1 RepID=A0A7C1W0N7_9GAMM|nr:rhodanese-like domain-containing protein [Methylophaga aminisulfidivorans]